MPAQPLMPKTKAKLFKSSQTVRPAPSAVTFRAGCEREWVVASSEPDLAYTEQAFPECPRCPHRAARTALGCW